MSGSYDLWIKKAELCHIPRWEELPDIDLYMDQVISQIDKYLVAIKIGNENILTASMVNNYVKQQLLPPPVKKRYNRSHMAYLISICLLKQSLSIPQIKSLLEAHIQSENLAEQYNLLCGIQEDALMCAAASGKSITPQDASNMAVKAALSSGANKVFAQQLISTNIECVLDKK